MKKTLTILTVLAVMLVAMMGSVFAAEVNATPTQVKAGDTVTVTVHSDTPCYGVQFNMTYDSTRFEYDGNTAGAVVSAEGGDLICSYSNVATSTNDVSLTFKVLTDAPVGTGDFTISGTEFTDTNGDVTGEAVTKPSVSVEVVASTPATEEPTDPEVKPGSTTQAGDNKGSTDNKGTSTEGEEKIGTNGEAIKKLPQTGAPLYIGVIALVVVAGAVVAVRKIRK